MDATMMSGAGLLEQVEKQGCLVLLRHGQTEWSLSGQYTGRTDLPLTQVGRQQAVDAGRRLAAEFPQAFSQGLVFTSPLARAHETAHLAGFPQAQAWDLLLEWDYGRAEGRKAQDIVAAMGMDWQLWRDGPEGVSLSLGGQRMAPLPSGGAIAVADSRGESLEEVFGRASQVVQWLQPKVEAGQQVLLVAHAHILRIITACWLGLEPAKGEVFRLSTAHYGVLGRYQHHNVLKSWNR